MNSKKVITRHVFLMVVIFVGALLRTFSVLAMYAVRMQDNACPPSYGACTELDKKQSSKRVRARILDLEARQQSEAERCCCWYPWHINDAVLDDIQAIAQEEALVGLSPANAKSLKSYFEKLQRKQRSCFSDRSEVVTWVGAITTAVGCYGTMMVADAQPGIVALEYGFPALCVCGCCTLAAAKLLQERYSISDFKRNNALDSLLATVSDAAASEKSTRAVRMDNNKGKHKSRASSDTLPLNQEQSRFESLTSRLSRLPIKSLTRCDDATISFSISGTSPLLSCSTRRLSSIANKF